VSGMPPNRHSWLRAPLITSLDIDPASKQQ